MCRISQIKCSYCYTSRKRLASSHFATKTPFKYPSKWIFVPTGEAKFQERGNRMAWVEPLFVQASVSHEQNTQECGPLSMTFKHVLTCLVNRLDVSDIVYVFRISMKGCRILGIQRLRNNSSNFSFYLSRHWSVSVIVVTGPVQS